MQISIINAGEGSDYLYGLVSALSQIDALRIEVVDSDSSVGLIDTFPNTKLFNLRGDNLSVQSFFVKAFRIIRYYERLLLYAARTKSQIFHIQWDNSFVLFDRTLLLLYYKLWGKKLIHTAHNVDRKERDGNTGIVNKFSLRVMYRLVHYIIVHTHKMKEEICNTYSIRSEKVIVIPHGINVRIPRTGMTKADARSKLGISNSAKVILFFGMVDRYKGIDLAIDAIAALAKTDQSIFFIVAGNPKRRSEYVTLLQSRACELLHTGQIRFDLHHILVENVESYFKASDCVVLPYKKIYQSGIIFLAYRFGIPIIATDVGSFREDIVDGETGFIARCDDTVDIADTMRKFFASDLYFDCERTRRHIIEYAEKKYSWSNIAQSTFELYARVLNKS